MREKDQFVHNGFTSFVLTGALEVSGEPPCELSFDEPFSGLKPEESEKHPGYKVYLYARIVISSLGLDANTNGILASLKGIAGELIECEFTNVVDPLRPSHKYTRYHSIKKLYQPR